MRADAASSASRASERASRKARSASPVGRTSRWPGWAGGSSFHKGHEGGLDMRTIALALGLGVLVSPATAEVVRFELTTPPRPALGGASFGSTGPYEEIRGSATIALDPADPRNAVIADLDRAPRNAQGRVEAVADVIILRPADPGRGNG